MNIVEIWKPVVGYEGRYEVSNLGRVKSLARIVKSVRRDKEVIMNKKEMFLKLCKRQNGYSEVKLYSNGGKETLILVHRLVAMAWIPNPENKLTVNHINSIKTDNRIENLEWNTISENRQHAVRTSKLNFDSPVPTYSDTYPKGEDNIYSKQVRIFIQEGYFLDFNCTREAADFLGVFPYNVIRCCGGHQETTGGRHCIYL